MLKECKRLLGSSAVRVAHLFSFLCFVLFVLALCLVSIVVLYLCTAHS